LLRPGDRPKQLQKWYDRLAPVVADARERLRQVDPAALAARSGCTEIDSSLQLTLLWEAYRIRLPDYAIQRVVSGQAPSTFTQALILTYLVTADGTTPSGRWIAYRDLPNGMFYAQAFRGYAENHLVRELGDDGQEAFCQGAARLGGREIDVGNAGYAFQILPRVHLAAVYWLGDEDFPSQASLLFEDSAPHYMSTDGLAVLGSHLVSAIIEASGVRRERDLA
jgi:hypothetical protein